MAKLIVIQGIPGSGKSTLARKLLKQDVTEKTIIVNRDSLRSMCGDYWVPKREKLITSLEENIIEDALDNYYSVIIDATNLNPATIDRWKEIAKEVGVPIEFKPLLVSPFRAYLQVLLRKLKGGRYIEYKVIKGFYNRYKNIIGV